MPSQGRNKTKYPGVYWAWGKTASGRALKRFSIVFKRGGKVYEEAAKVLIDSGPETRPAENPQEANAWRSRRIAEVAAPAVERPPYTLNDLWAKWSSGKERRGGFQATESRYRVHIAPVFGGKTPEELTDAAVDTFREGLEAAGRAPATVKAVMVLLSSLIKWGAEEGYTPRVELRFRFPAVDNEKTESMTVDQLAAYWRALDEEQDQHVADFFRIMLLTGIRRSALMALEWADVDMDRGFLTLQGASAKNGKTKTIPLPARAVDIFRAMPRTDSPLVWPGQKGPLTTIPAIGARIRDRAGLPKDFRPCHGLRHTFASCLASSGQVDLYTLQTLLTHSDSAMTQRYAHLSSVALARAASVADSVLAPAQAVEIDANGRPGGM